METKTSIQNSIKKSLDVLIAQGMDSETKIQLYEYLEKVLGPKPKTIKEKCGIITKDKTPCKNNKKEGCETCAIHDSTTKPVKPQCTHKFVRGVNKGQMCPKNARPGTDLCGLHTPKPPKVPVV